MSLSPLNIELKWRQGSHNTMSNSLQKRKIRCVDCRRHGFVLVKSKANVKTYRCDNCTAKMLGVDVIGRTL